MYEVTEKILREVRKVIVGKDDVVEKVCKAHALPPVTLPVIFLTYFLSPSI